MPKLLAMSPRTLPQTAKSPNVPGALFPSALGGTSASPMRTPPQAAAYTVTNVYEFYVVICSSMLSYVRLGSGMLGVCSRRLPYRRSFGLARKGLGEIPSSLDP